jgi:hypothetical protein
VSGDINFEEEFASRKSHVPILVTKHEELDAMEVEPESLVTSRAVQQPSREEEKTISPSTFVRRP